MNNNTNIYKLKDLYRRYDKIDYITMLHYLNEINKIEKNELLKDMLNLPDNNKTPFWIKILDNNEIEIYTNSNLHNLYDFIHNKLELLSYSQIIRHPNDFIESVISNKYILNQKLINKLLLQKYDKKIDNICVLFGDFIPYIKEISKHYDMTVYLTNEKILNKIIDKIDTVDVYLYDLYSKNNNEVIYTINNNRKNINSIKLFRTRITEYDSLKKSINNFTKYTNLSFKVSTYSKQKYLHENIARIETIK